MCICSLFLCYYCSSNKPDEFLGSAKGIIEPFLYGCFEQKRVKMCVFVCVCMCMCNCTCTHTYNDTSIFLCVSLSQGCACFSHEGLLKRNSGNVTTLERKPNRLFFRSLFSSYSPFLIECLPPNNATFPPSIYLCREPTPFLLIST